MSNDTPIKVKWWEDYIEKYPKFTGCLIDKDDDKAWYKNGKCHRTGGPAIEFANGNKWWYLNGENHRTDGPAIENANGNKWWYLNGIQYTEQEHRIAVRHIKLKILDTM
jgi:hypothetical protein